MQTSGPESAPALVFAHGFGCDSRMWRLVAPAFEADHRVVLLDLVGAGESDLSAWDPERYADLSGYVDDVVAVIDQLDLRDVVLVGHSVSAMIGVLAQARVPQRFARLVLVGPSARYLDDDGYVGGFSEADISDLLELMKSNHFGWQDPLAAMVMANPERPELKDELEDSFCRTRPDIAEQFARVTFLGDNRADLDAVTVPTLVIQTRDDVIAPMSAGELVRDRIQGSSWVVIEGGGHCPHLSDPEATIAAIRAFLPR